MGGTLTPNVGFNNAKIGKEWFGETRTRRSFFGTGTVL